MVAASPASAKEKDYYGSIPLHVALKNNETPEAVVLALIAAWPASAKEKGGYGKTALHYALLCKDTASVKSATSFMMQIESLCSRTLIGRSRPPTLLREDERTIHYPHPCPPLDAVDLRYSTFADVRSAADDVIAFEG